MEPPGEGGRKSRGSGEGALVPEECAPHSGRIRGATEPAEIETQPCVIQTKGK